MIKEGKKYTYKELSDIITEACAKACDNFKEATMKKYKKEDSNKVVADMMHNILFVSFLMKNLFDKGDNK